MTAPAAPGGSARGRDRIGAIGAALAVVLAALVAWPAPWVERLQSAWFDACQQLAPRQVSTLPVTVVEIDQKSLAALGQWPWPRTRLARLVTTIARADAAAIGVDLLMPEADALSPERALAEAGPGDAALAEALRARPTNDAVLAAALAAAPAVLVVAGASEKTGMALRAAPVVVQSTNGATAAGLDLVGHAGALTAIDELNRRASGWGLISVETTRGIVRRVALVASIQGTLVPALAVEMLRVAWRAPTVRLVVSGRSTTALAVGEISVRTETDAAVRPYFSHRRADRFVSAVDVLEGRVDPALLRRQLVIVGPTAIGLESFHDTPIGERMSGSEIQAQLLENLIDGTALRRPPWATAAEALWVLVAGALLAWRLPRASPWRVGALMLVLVAAPPLAAFALFRGRGELLDAATPAASLLVLFGVLLMLALAESLRQRRALESVVQRQREQSARIAGELAAAQRIQAASLPRAELLKDGRVDLHAALTPAREVGGDLYDFFKLDDDRLFVLIGDVAGKGLSASIFMAVSKALYKGVMLRAPHGDVGAAMSAANAEVSRDNAEMLFVTAFAAVLDLRSGELSYCNAGHDNPYRFHDDDAAPSRIVDGDGPPLCAVPGFAYPSARLRLAAGDMLCLMTDGVAEAHDPAGAMYGHDRIARAAAEALGGGASARELVEALQAGARAFAAGAEASDDLAIVALRWRGPAR